jgi:hypothetical protein
MSWPSTIVSEFVQVVYEVRSLADTVHRDKVERLMKFFEIS